MYACNWEAFEAWAKREGLKFRPDSFEVGLAFRTDSRTSAKIAKKAMEMGFEYYVYTEDNCIVTEIYEC